MDSLYRVESNNPNHQQIFQHSNESTTSSLNSNIKQTLKFWKTGSEIPITSSSISSERRGIGSTKAHRKTRSNSLKNLQKFSEIIWKYGKWPLALIGFCLLVGLIIFLFVDTTTTVNITENAMSNINLFYESPTTTTTPPNPEENTTNDEDLSTDVTDPKFDSTILPLIINGHAVNYDNRTDTTSIPIKNTEITTVKSEKEINPITNQIYTSTDQYSPDEETTMFSIERVADRTKDYQEITRTTGIIVTTEETVNQIKSKTKVLAPTKETLQIFGFTSGHQNNFGVPIEEDERILRIFNEEIINNSKKVSNDYLNSFKAYKYNTNNNY